MPKFMNFAKITRDVIGSEEKFEGYKQLMFDLINGETVGRSKEDGEKKLHTMLCSIAELPTEPTQKQVRRALRKHAADVYEVIEDAVDMQVKKGWQESEFFNQFVETKTVGIDDILEFTTEDQTFLSIAKVSGEHHDFLLQRLGEGESYTVQISTYGAAVGASLTRYFVGQEDWQKLINKIATAFTAKIQNELYAAVMNAYKKLPIQDKLVTNGELVKDAVDEKIEMVGGLNDSDVYIMGTKLALKKFNALTDVDWRATSQKEDVARLGRLGSYESTDLIEIPQRFDNNDITKKLVDDKVLLFMPKTGDRFVKFVDGNNTEITQVTEKGVKGGRVDDLMSYEITRDMGVAVVLGRYFGVHILN